MARFVLVADSSLNASYRNFPLLDFLPSAPVEGIPKPIYNFLKGKPYKALPDGSISVTSYALRKIEAALLQRFPRNEVVLAHEKYLDRFITDDTEIIGVDTMDPLGTGPVTMSYIALLKSKKGAWVTQEWLRLIRKINRIRKGKKAKLLIGGPGVWDFTLFPEELDKENIDYAFQGESDDVICDLFEQLPKGELNKDEFFEGYVTMDENFHRSLVKHPKFISRSPKIGLGAPISKIPTIVAPAHGGMVEIMRGCGIGCDFCEVTLRPLRYYTNEMIIKEIEANVRGGYDNAWLHTDEIFGFRHTKTNFEPNEEALIDLFKTVMSVKGVKRTNPTHGRISPAAAYPDLIKKLSEIIKAGPDNWIGMQVGVETGSDILAKRHMPNKTLPLHVGPDGTWREIVWEGTRNLNKYFWRPAFTLQVGQAEETDEDNWDSVALINQLSNGYVDNRPFEFTITPLQNVPMGLIKSREFSQITLSPSQLAVYYASYRHLYKMAVRNARLESQRSGNKLAKFGTSTLISVGAWAMMEFVESIARKGGADIEKAKTYGLESPSKRIETISMIEK
ncbi:MAG: B12-binding domain-containing radical SAM protein [Candidatus Micrarchaeia archaeon]